jgi:hypothetical protein
MTGTRAITWIGAGILALVVASAVIVLLAEGRAPTSFPAGSAQAAMQGYLAAWEERDLERAYGYFSDDIQARISLDDYQNAVRGYGEFPPGEEAVFIDAAEGSGDSTTLHLSVERYYGEGPGAGSDRTQTTVRMVRQADGWKIDDQLIGVESTPFPFDEQPF